MFQDKVWSLEDFELGSAIAKGCSAVVYSARAKNSKVQFKGSILLIQTCQNYPIDFKLYVMIRKLLGMIQEAQQLFNRYQIVHLKHAEVFFHFRHQLFVRYNYLIHLVFGITILKIAKYNIISDPSSNEMYLFSIPYFRNFATNLCRIFCLELQINVLFIKI